MTAEKRRQYGSGAVYQRADGRWVGAITAGWTADGKRRRITVSAKTEAACKRAVEKRKAEIARDGAPAESTNRHATVKSWSATWLERTVHEVRPKTWLANRFAVNRQIIPVIGHRRLDLLTPADIESVVNACRTKGNAYTTILRCRTVLMKLLRDAEDAGHAIPPRVITKGKMKPPKTNRGPLALDDARAIMVAAASIIDGSRWFMALHTGARQGECLGLTWDRVDFRRGFVDISWQLQALPYVSGRAGALRIPDGYEHQRLDGGLCLVRPKGEDRVVPMSATLRAQLEDWHAKAPRSPHNLVWPRPDGRPRSANEDRADWKAVQTLAGIDRDKPYQLHELRHTAATIMLENGIRPEVIQEILGHSAVVTTMRYAHINQSLTTQAVDALDRGLLAPADLKHALPR